ncbi:MAG TPA: hypothetical protein VNT50_07585 [Microbacterium sp.]|uniref:hypothetical protein n=1 Tax=Microbacterium sp. TaxID=51671 RepID=UPI002B91D54F|nr:hypothetical protein [Microbacterium sp.]HWI31337.1 hypothetical protein [Microbacterium sp.]
MTLRDFFSALIRRWPIVLIGALCTTVLCVVATRDDGTYWSRSEVVFMAPSSTLFPNSLKTRSEDLIITAGIVGKLVVGPDRPLKFASPQVDLIGIPGGGSYWLRLPDSGGQWAPNFGDQLLLLDVVGDTVEEAEATRAEVVDRVRTELYDLQREYNVDPVNDITITIAPESVVVHHLTGSTIRTLGMTGLLGVAATVALVLGVELRSRRRSFVSF